MAFLKLGRNFSDGLDFGALSLCLSRDSCLRCLAFSAAVVGIVALLEIRTDGQGGNKR
jgi:hypothetical protein